MLQNKGLLQALCFFTARRTLKETVCLACRANRLFQLICGMLYYWYPIRNRNTQNGSVAYFTTGILYVIVMRKTDLWHALLLASYT